jgi:hypothetical protein
MKLNVRQKAGLARVCDMLAIAAVIGLFIVDFPRDPVLQGGEG